MYLDLNEREMFMTRYNVDYTIHGEEMQFVQIGLNPNETAVAEAGSLMMMDYPIKMETVFGDGSNQSTGVMGKLLGAGKRLLTGESLFITTFTNTGSGKESVFFAAPYPGKIIPLDLSQYQGKIICQKDAYLASTQGVQIGVEFQRKLGVGFFGGEGFIMQKLEGDGLAFIHAGGTIANIDLQPGEKLRVDTGCLVAFTRDVRYNIEMVRGIKTALFGGEGLFFATLEGPGTVWIQSLPFSRLASRVFSAMPQNGGSRDEGGIGGLFNIFGGDR
jgi:uncharacterized protein (TIGR00266 family)